MAKSITPGCLLATAPAGRGKAVNDLTAFAQPAGSVASRQPSIVDHFHKAGVDTCHAARMPSHNSLETPVVTGIGDSALERVADTLSGVQSTQPS